MLRPIQHYSLLTAHYSLFTSHQSRATCLTPPATSRTFQPAALLLGLRPNAAPVLRLERYE